MNQIPSTGSTITTVSDELIKLRKQSLQNIANGSLILATILFFINLFVAIQLSNLVMGIVVFALYACCFFAAFMQSFPLKLRAWLLSATFFGTGILSIISQGINANGVLYFFTCILLLAVLMDNREWIWGIIGSAIALSILGILIGYNVIHQGIFVVQSNSPLYWASIVIFMLFITYLITSTITRILQSLQKTLISVYDIDQEIKQRDQNLTSQIASLEIELDRRRSRLIAARQIAREISQTSDLNTLLRESVELVRNQFGFSHTGIFLKDAKSEFAVLRAATGEAGKTMLARKHKLKIRDEGIVGYVVARGEVRISSDVGEDAVHYKNPLLPATRSEMAIPLRTAQGVIGALDIQSDKANAFTAEDVEIIQTIADQLAVAIDKAQQISQLKQSILELEEGYRTFTSGAWRAHLRGSRKKINFVYNKDHVSEANQPVPLYKEAISSGKLVTAQFSETNDESGQGVLVSVPIKLRDQILGVMNLKYAGKNLPSDLKNLMNTASDRLAIALENARLLEQIQEQAETEHVVTDIANKVRSSADIDTILRTTALELGKSMGIDEVRIQLKTSNSEN